MNISTYVVGKLLNNTYQITTKKGNAVIIDPGVDYETIEAGLRASGAELKYILLTHGHYDHIASAKRLSKETGAKTVIGARDAEMTVDCEKSLSFLFTGKPELFEADIIVNDGDIITLDELEFKFLSTPGHTKGSMVIICDDVMFSGDTVLKGTVGRTDFYGGSESLMLQSVKKLSSLEKNYRMLSGHGEVSSLNEEKCRNAYFIEYV